MPNPTEWEATVDRYFHTYNPWGSINRSPDDIGQTVRRNDDMTFGDNELNELRHLFECQVCGAAVADWRKHIDWHEALSTT